MKGSSPRPVISTRTHLGAMNAPSLGGAAPAAHPGEFADSLHSGLSALYALSQDSGHIFASPVGPFPAAGRAAYLPRFVFFGPHACDDSWRLAFLAGLDHDDLRSSRALVALATRLAADGEIGHGLNLTFFPLVDVTGLVTGASHRRLAEARWGPGAAPELGLLEWDARQRGYHGFVRIETGNDDEDLIILRVRGPFADSRSPDLELITSEETRTFPVRFEATAGGPARDGPLSITDDLPLAPFELTLRIPGSWSDDAYQHAAVTLLERFLVRYRAFQAFGQHL
jgi:hypothetical protein